MPTFPYELRRIRAELAALLPSEAKSQLVMLDLQDAKSLIRIAADREIDDEVRRLAVVVIGKLRIRGAVPILVESLSEDKPNLALSSAHALGLIRSRDATMALIRVLDQCPYFRNREA